MPSPSARLLATLVAAAAMAVPGCVLAPPEATEEKARLRAEGQIYVIPAESRELPALPVAPTWQQLLRQAFLANGDLEAAYYEWSAAVARIDQAGSYPNTPVMVNFSYMFSAERMKSFDRLTTTVGPDPMESLALPSKVYQAAKVATADARAAGSRFAAAKFDLQRKVLVGWVDFALAAERGRVARENVALLRLIRDTAAARVRAGGAQQDMLRAEVELARAEDDLRTTESDLPRMRAMLNAMAGRPPEAPLDPPDAMPPARPLPADDATLVARAAEANPALTTLARRVEGRADALELARLQYLPDINPMAGFTGGVSQMVGVGLSLPGLMPRVRGMVDEARADLRAAESMRRQARLDQSAQAVATLYGLRNSERQAALFDATVVPAAERVADNARESYARGTASFLDMVEAQRTLLDARLTLAEARASRERGLAELEALLGLDIETLAAPAAIVRPPASPGAATTFGTTRPATGPTEGTLP